MIRLTVRQMQYFAALAETLHFGKAAALAGVSQPALSAQIAEMEERLACRLFERARNKVTMTEEARSIHFHIERILGEIRDVEAIALKGRGALEGRFRLGIIPTIAPYLLPHILPGLKRRFEGLQLELREALTATLVEEALSGRLDGFVAALPIEAPGLISETLFVDRFLLAVPPDDPSFAEPPVSPDSPALERLMLLEEGHCLRDQALAVCSSVKPLAMASYGATSLTTLLQMVSHGLGITLIPEMALASSQSMSDLKIVPFAEPAPSRTICLAWRRNSPRAPECATLAEFIRGLSAALVSDDREDVKREPDPHDCEHEEAEDKGRLA